MENTTVLHKPSINHEPQLAAVFERKFVHFTNRFHEVK